MIAIRASFIPAIAIFAAGCASVPLAPREADLAAKRFEPPPGQANLYVYRNERFGGAARLSVALDGALLGDTAAMTYLYTPIAPGRHTIVSKAENDSDATIDAKAGTNYFLWQEVKMGLWTARSALRDMPEKTGREAVLECTMGSTRAPPASPGCATDRDCKGERICRAGVCGEPGPLVN
ncbi:MAG: hypothetical protein NVS2B9_03990 [Myxococcales bacterium]